MKILILCLAYLFSFSLFSQLGIGTNVPNATLDVQGLPNNITIADGLIAPKLTRAQLIDKTAYGTNQIGAIVYITDITGTTTPSTSEVLNTGYYFFNGTKWVNIVTENGSPKVYWTGNRFPSLIYDNFSLSGNPILNATIADGSLIISKAGFSVFIKNGLNFELINQDLKNRVKNASGVTLSAGQLVYYTSADLTSSGVRSVTDPEFLSVIDKQPKLAIVSNEFLVSDITTASASDLLVVSESPSIILNCSEGNINDELYLVDGQFITFKPSGGLFYYIGKILQKISSTKVRIQFQPKFYDHSNFGYLLVSSNVPVLQLYDSETIKSNSVFDIEANVDTEIAIPSIPNLIKNIELINSSTSTNDVIINALNGTIILKPKDRIHLLVNQGELFVERYSNLNYYFTDENIPTVVYNNFNLLGNQSTIYQIPDGSIILSKKNFKVFIKKDNSIYLQNQDHSFLAKNISTLNLYYSELVFIKDNIGLLGGPTPLLTEGLSNWGIGKINSSFSSTQLINKSPKLAIIKSTIGQLGSEVIDGEFTLISTESSSILLKTDGVGGLGDELYLKDNQFVTSKPTNGKFYYIGKVIQVVDGNHNRIQFFPEFFDYSQFNELTFTNVGTNYTLTTENIQDNKLLTFVQQNNDVTIIIPNSFLSNFTKNIDIINDFTSTKKINVLLSSGLKVLYPGSKLSILIKNNKTYSDNLSTDFCFLKTTNNNVNSNSDLVFNSSYYRGNSIRLVGSATSVSGLELDPGLYEITGNFAIDQGVAGQPKWGVLSLVNYDTNNSYNISSSAITVDFAHSATSQPNLSSIIEFSTITKIKLKYTAGGSTTIANCNFLIKRIN